MDMMSCPHCGAVNSRKRTTCFQCEENLHTLPTSTPHQGMTCAQCGLAARAAPFGEFLASDHLWCMHRKAAVLSTTAADMCFQETFGWNREQIMD